MTKRLIHSLKYSRSATDRRGQPDLRDEPALHEIQAAILARGFLLGEQIFNLPPAEPPDDPLAPGALLPIDRSRFGPDDLILAVTRPPMDDKRDGGKKQVARGYTDLEERCFEEWRRYLASCSRIHVELSGHAMRALPEEHRHLAWMQFRQYQGCWFMKLNDGQGGGWRRPDGPPHSAAFLLRIPALWKGGPGLLWAFGMDGLATLVLCRRLATTHNHLLDHEGFTMLRTEHVERPVRHANLDWTAKGELEVVMQVPGPGVELKPLPKSGLRKKAPRPAPAKPPTKPPAKPARGSGAPAPKRQGKRK